MITPRVKRTGGSWLFAWDEPYQVSMRVDRVRQHTAGNISGELHVVSGSDPLSLNGHMHHSEMSNLLGPRVRQDIVRSLSERLETLPWTDLLEYVLETVLFDMRRGEPMVAVSSIALPQEQQWVHPPILRVDQPTIVFGYGGTLKSWLLAYWGVQIATNGYSVAVLDWESTPEDWAIRVSMVAEGLHLPIPAALYYRRCVTPLADDIEAIRAHISEHGATVTFIDSAGYASNDEPERAATAMTFFRALRSLGTSSIIVAHQRQDDKSRRPFGSVFWENSARSTIQIRKAEERGNSVKVGFFNRKVNFGKPFQAFALDAAFHVFDKDKYTQGDYVLFTQGELASEKTLAQEGSSKDKVLNFLYEQDDRVTPKRIEEETGVKSIREVLRRLKAQGLVEGEDQAWQLDLAVRSRFDQQE